MNRPVQYFTKEYLESCKGATPDQIIEFLENYRMLISDVSEKSQFGSLDIFKDLPNDQIYERVLASSKAALASNRPLPKNLIENAICAEL